MAILKAPDEHRARRAMIALLATLPLLIAALAIPLMHYFVPFSSDALTSLAIAMVVFGAIAWTLGYAGLSLSQHFPRAGLRAQLAIPVLASTLTALAGTVVIARMMFITQRDLILLSILLLFAALISLPVAWWTAHALATRVEHISRAAFEMAQGNLEARVSVNGNDEIGQLANSFNWMAEQLERAQQQRITIERARKEMLVAISHDLRTPLSSIQAMGEAILDDVVDDNTSREYVRQMLAETDNLSVLINDLFELSQIDIGNVSLRREPIDLRDLLSDTVNAMQIAAERQRVQLQGEILEPIPLVLADSARIQRVLTNLVQNALQHTGEGGKITLHAERTEPGVVIRVCDTGCGIDAEALPHIFDSFYRADQARSDGGAGLGLTIAKGIVEAHGGTIEAESEPGTGTTIWFTLPTAPASTEMQ